MKNIEAAKEQKKIDPELHRMHEIFGHPDPDPNPDCGKYIKYENGTCSKAVFDPKMSFRKRIDIEQQPLSEAEKQATRFYQFSHILQRKSRNEY